MLGALTNVIVIAAIILWALIAVIFVAVKVRNMMQHKKYSVKQQGDVSTEYKAKGLE